MPLTKYVIAKGGDLDYANDRHQSRSGVLCMYVRILMIVEFHSVVVEIQ